MKFVFIDYSEHYYRHVKKEELPGRREGKFIQVRGRGAEYLVLSPKAFSPYHANIVERFFLSQGLQGSYNHKRDHYLPRSEGWSVVGGGSWAMDSSTVKLVLRGTSMAYGKFDSRGLGERLRAMPELAGIQIEINP